MDHSSNFKTASGPNYLMKFFRHFISPGIALICCMCSNTEYAKNYSKEGFGSIKIGDSIDIVEMNIGKPISIYKYTMNNGVAISHATPSSWEEMDKESGSDSIMYILYYSNQINSRRDYMHIHLSVTKGVVREKSFQWITE